jgi:hypothetical protein
MESQMKIENNEIKDIKALIDVVVEVNKLFQGQVWWRGQACYKWQLSPSIFRPEIRKNGGYQFEKNANHRFMQRAPSRFPNIPKNEEWWEWLSLMQHFGMPTRLLDWTESPLFACFFAVKDFVIDNGALFALNPYYLNMDQIDESILLLSTHDNVKEIAEKAFCRDEAPIDLILGVLPTESNERIMVQLSVFTIHGSDRLLEELPSHELFLYKFKIPHDSKIKIKNQLKDLGVRESNLFPDLEHLAIDTKSLKFIDSNSPISGLEKEESSNSQNTIPST